MKQLFSSLVRKWSEQGEHESVSSDNVREEAKYRVEDWVDGVKSATSTSVTSEK